MCCNDGSVIVAVYINDIMIGGKTDGKIKEVKRTIVDCFEAKNLGELHYFLAVIVVQIWTTSLLEKCCSIIWHGKCKH